MFIGNPIQYSDLLTWLTSTTDPECVCIVCGPTGCGKTHGIMAAAEATGKMISVFDSSTCLNGKDFKDKILKTTQSNVLAQFTARSYADRMVFIDELDALLSIDRTFLSNLKGMPQAIKVVIAATPEASRRVAIPHKLITLNAASQGDILALLREREKKMGRRLNAKRLLEAVELCSGNLAAAIRHTDAVVKKAAKSKQTENETKDAQRDAFSDLAAVYRNTSLAYQVFSADSWLNPLRFHENLVHEMKQRTKPRQGKHPQKEEVYRDLMGDFCFWDTCMSSGSGSEDVAMHYLAAATKRLDSLTLKKTAAPPAAEFTRLINMLSVRKKGILGLYANAGANSGSFPWHQVGAYEKSFLQRK
jgi:SpoVK/Ycf46/Vps4 family AAA+-type ATPase